MIDKIINSKSRIQYHLYFWMTYIAFYTVMWGGYDGNYWGDFQQLIILLPTMLVPAYITLYYLMPKFLFKKKTLKYISYSILLAIIMGLLYRYIKWAHLSHWYNVEKEYWKTPMFYFPKILASIVSVYSPVFIAMSIKLQLFYYKNDKINKQLEKEKIATELKFLKAQIHPHFLFNTLNSIYSLSLSKSQKTPEAVLGLSKFLDYMLYECNDRFISIGIEWEQLMNLVKLERLRYSDNLTINVSNVIDDKECIIPSLLLLPFVENAFKHGVDNEINDSWINIDLKLEDKQLSFYVENSMSVAKLGENLDSDKNIGLKNVKRRLSLFFKDKYELKIMKEEDSFLVKLTINLNDIAKTMMNEDNQ